MPDLLTLVDRRNELSPGGWDEYRGQGVNGNGELEQGGRAEGNGDKDSEKLPSEEPRNCEGADLSEEETEAEETLYAGEQGGGGKESSVDCSTELG